MNKPFFKVGDIVEFDSEQTTIRHNVELYQAGALGHDRIGHFIGASVMERRFFVVEVVQKEFSNIGIQEIPGEGMCIWKGVFFKHVSALDLAQHKVRKLRGEI